MKTPKHIVAASALVTNADGNVLMIESPKRGWEIPGGQVEQGEDLMVALKREVREETGVEIAPGPLVGVCSNLSAEVVIFSFLARYESGELTTSAESLQVEWVAPDECIARVEHPAIKARIEDLLNFVGTPHYRAYTLDPYVVTNERVL